MEQFIGCDAHKKWKPVVATVDWCHEMARSGHRPKLCNPLEAKRRMGLTKKTDTPDARGRPLGRRNWSLLCSSGRDRL